MTTEKQILANKENAQKSTGPINTMLTSKNAQKYGIFSKDLIINCKYFKENVREFDEIKKQFEEEYSPKTITEKILIEEAIDAYWRMRRLRRARQAGIIKNLETCEYEADRDVDLRDSTRQLWCEMSYGRFRYITHPQMEEKLKELHQRREKFILEEMSEAEIDDELLNGLWVEVPGGENISNWSIDKKREILGEAFEEEFRWHSEPFNKKLQEKREVEWLKKKEALILEEVNWGNLSAYETTLERKFYRAITTLRQMKGMLV